MSDAMSLNVADLTSFRKHLSKSKRIVALLGAGLSASSGLPTFRGAGGLWRTHDAISLATPEAFEANPALVWQFYSYRRHMALNAKPNAAHMALTALSNKKPEFLTLSQNVDGLSPRAGHPADQLKLLHGNLFDVKCFDEDGCGYARANDFTDPIVPALQIPQETVQAEQSLQSGQQDHHDTSGDLSARPVNTLIRGADISDINVPIPDVRISDLPQCPQCQKHLLRPGVVWFGEALPEQTLADIDAYFSTDKKIDLMLVIGTSSKVYPAAGYTGFARHKGARVAVVNLEMDGAGTLTDKDWFFRGDAAQVLPELFMDEIGTVQLFQG